MRFNSLQFGKAMSAALFVLLLSVAGVTKAMAQTFTVGNLDYSLNDDGVSVTVTGHVDGTSATGSLLIPESVTYNGTAYTVTSIGNNAFYGCNGFNGILTIPNSVTYISQWAFKNCSGFSEVHYNATNCIVYGARPPFEGCGGMLTIADNVEAIPANIFYNAAFTGNLVIPNSVTTIGDAAFIGCSGLTGSLTIPNSVTTIGDNAFHNCTGFTGSLTIPHTVTTIGRQAFYGCNGFTGSLTIGDAVTTIGESAFRNCGFTDSLTIGNSVTTIGNFAFYGCTGFSGSLTIPNSVITIGNYAFNGCTGFSGSLTIPNSVITIGNYAFSDCTGFSDSLTIGNAVTTIGGGAFKNCTGFWGELVIPNSVLTIQSSEYGGYGAFQNCSGFSSLVLGVSLTTIGDAAFRNCTGFSGSLTIPNSVTTIGGSAFEGCNGFTGNLTIPNSVTTIGSRAFLRIVGFTGSLTIPNSVTTIGSYAFSSCNGFTGSLTLGNSLTTIGEGAFGSCSGFTGSLTIPNSVTTIGNSAFSGCSGFTGSLTIPNSVTTIDYAAFSGCSGFTGSLTIPNSVTTIDYAAFSGCSGFTGSLTIPNSVTTIGNYAFSGCSGFTGSLTIPHAVTSIGEYAFENCNGFTCVYYTGGINQWCNIWFSNAYSNPLYYAHNLYINNELLTDLVIPVSVTQIKQYAFLGATCLTSLTIGNNVNMIGEYAFYGCSGLTGVLNFPNVVNSIGNYAFYGCSGFTGNLTIPNHVTSIGYSAFRSCSGFTGSLTLGNSVNSIGSYAFNGCNGITEIYSNRTTPPTIYSGSYVFSNYSVPVYVPCGSEEAYQAATGWNNFTHIIGMCPGTVTVAANPIEGGTVTGGGYFESGEECTVTATANEGYVFANWTKNGVIVSTNASYSFYVAGDAVLVANFTSEGNIVFVDANVKAICVEHWDTNGDGELSYAEAASVSDLGTYFQYNEEITSFDELQYFIGLSSIGDYAFYYCTGLSSFVLSNTITSIGEGAFAECDALTSIVLPSSLTLIDEAFYGCENVQLIISLAATPPNIGYYTFDGLYDRPLLVPCEALEAYQNAACWLYFTNIQGMCGGTVTIEANPSEGGTVAGGGYYESGTQCTVTATANEGFSFVNWTKNGVMVSTNAEYTFPITGDISLVANFVDQSSIIVFADANVKNICILHWDIDGDSELNYDEAAAVTSLDYHFQNNSEITSFDELQYFIGLSSIGNSEFYYCSGLTSIMLPNSLTTIGNSAFYDCYGLSSIELPNSLTTIGNYAFYDCYGLSSIELSNSLTTIGNYAFYNCYGLSSIELPNSLTTIENSAFYNCSGLSSIELPSSLITIGNYAFYNCSNLQSISSYAITPPSISSSTFSGLYNKQLLVPCNALEAYQNANYWSYFTNIVGMCPGTIIVEANPTEGGTVTGGGYYESGEQCTVTATANEGFIFVNWTQNGVIVSTNAEYTFFVIGDATLVAYFRNAIGTVTASYYPEPMNPESPYVMVTWGTNTDSFESQIGYGTSTFNYFPFYTMYNYSIAECLFLAAELESAGVSIAPMTSLSWYATNTTGYNQQGISIWMANVDDEALTTNSHVVTGMTLVYTGAMTPLIGWNEFVFNQDTFAWDGHSNILIYCQRNNGEWNSSIKWEATSNMPFNASSYNYRDIDAFDATVSQTMTISTARPNTLFKSSINRENNYYYKIYRTDCDDNNYSLIADNVTSPFVDSSWLQLPVGSYQYGVSFINDEGNESEIVASNCIDRNLYTYQITATPNFEERGTVTGTGTYPIGSLCTLLATPNDGYAFVNWTKNNVEVSTEATYSFTVTENATFVANFSESQGTITQTSSFSQGYNWWSTYIEQEGINGLEMLENSLGGNGVAIRSQASGYTDYYGEDYGWWGSLTSINNESSYRVVANTPCTVTMTGTEAVPSQHPIMLNHGWTWMGYVPSTAMDVNTAMAGMGASEGDMLKSQQGYADYYPNYGWYGSLNTIEPGMGLMYYSASGETVTFTYPDNTRGGELKKNLTAENNHWKPNTFAYPDNMTVMAVVELNEMEVKSDNYELAAFANGECRGSVRLTYAEPINRHVAFLTISGKDAAELNFRLYDMETGMEYYDAEESLDFVANAIVGEADDLYTIHFRGTTGMDEFASKVQVYPNPVNVGERFSINVADDVKTPVRVEIVNALGVEMLRATSVQMPAQLTAPATAGVYTLRITVEGKGTVVRKLVVK